MQRDGLGCLRLDGRAELKFAMVRGNEVQQMQAHVFALRLEVLPIFERKGFPEGVD